MASLSSLKKRYQRSLSNNDYYGAEQAIRMIHHRLTKSKTASPSDMLTAYETLVDAAKTLLKSHQTQAGTALALLAIKHNSDQNVKVSASGIASIKAINDAYTEPTTEQGTNDTLLAEHYREKLRFLQAAATWSTKPDCNGTRNGNPTLNALAAKAATQAGQFILAQKYFICSDAPEDFALALSDYATKLTLPSEKALVLTRAVLQYLVSENIKDAITFRVAYVKALGWRSVSDSANLAGSPAPPLANFCELLIKLCQLETTAVPLFKSIVETYDVELKRDESFSSMLTQIGTKYMGIQPPAPSGLGGMMGSMLRNLMPNA